MAAGFDQQNGHNWSSVGMLVQQAVMTKHKIELRLTLASSVLLTARQLVYIGTVTYAMPNT